MVYLLAESGAHPSQHPNPRSVHKIYLIGETGAKPQLGPASGWASVLCWQGTQRPPTSGDEDCAIVTSSLSRILCGVRSVSSEAGSKSEPKTIETGAVVTCDGCAAES